MPICLTLFELLKVKLSLETGAKYPLFFAVANSTDYTLTPNDETILSLFYPYCLQKIAMVKEKRSGVL